MFAASSKSACLKTAAPCALRLAATLRTFLNFILLKAYRRKPGNWFRRRCWVHREGRLGRTLR